MVVDLTITREEECNSYKQFYSDSEDNGRWDGNCNLYFNTFSCSHFWHSSEYTCYSSRVRWTSSSKKKLFTNDHTVWIAIIMAADTQRRARILTTDDVSNLWPDFAQLYSRKMTCEPLEKCFEANWSHTSHMYGTRHSVDVRKCLHWFAIHIIPCLFYCTKGSRKRWNYMMNQQNY